MSVIMLRRALKDLRWTALWYVVGVALYGVLIMLVYPTMRRNATSFEDIIKTYPDAFLKAFGVTTNMFEMPAFVSAEFLNVIWPLIVAIFVIMAGTATVAQEIERGTIELWLSVPESRARLLIAKIVSLVIGVVIVSGATVVAIEIGALLVGESFGLSHLIALFPCLLAFPLAVAGYSVLFSSFSRERSKAAALAAFATLGFYLMWVFAALVDRLSWMRYLSIFTAFKPQRALETGTFFWQQFLILMGVGVVCSAVAVLVFERRDANP